MVGPNKYLIALGSNQRRPGIGAPRKVLKAAIQALAGDGWTVEVASRFSESNPIGPSQRRYVNGAAIISGDLEPVQTLANLQEIEDSFGRQRRGQRWRSRTLDLDIILWNGGVWHSPGLVIPHPLFRQRPFALHPAAQIAPHWRDPVTGHTLRQIAARL